MSRGKPIHLSTKSKRDQSQELEEKSAVSQADSVPPENFYDGEECDYYDRGGSVATAEYGPVAVTQDPSSSNR